MPRRQSTGPDPLTPEQRRLNMSLIRSKDTKPELQLRRALHGAGFRYRLHDRTLPGTPDLVLPGKHAVVFLHGCFWHGHDCPLGVIPATRRTFWEEKIGRNQIRDEGARVALLAGGWRVLTVWECALRGRGRMPSDKLLTHAAKFLHSNEPELSIRSEILAAGGQNV